MTIEPGPPPGSRAILIGVSAYEDPEFPPIRAARNSLNAMRTLLEDPDLCGWPADAVTVIANPHAAADLAVTLAEQAKATHGALLVYFVGHGTLSQRGELSLAVTGTQFEHPHLTGVLWSQVAEALRESPAPVRIAILDCCFSGRAIEALAGRADTAVADFTHIVGVYTLTATTRNETAHVVPPDRQGTAATSFTGELCDLVTSGIPHKPVQLTFADIYPELRRRLRAKGLPAPSQRGTDTASSYRFTANAAARTGVGADPTRPGTGPNRAARTTATAGRADAPDKPTPWIAANEVELLQLPGEASAFRKDVKRFKDPDADRNLLATELEQLGPDRAALRLNYLGSRTAALIVDKMVVGPAAATLLATKNSGKAARILQSMDPARAAAALECMDDGRAAAILSGVAVVEAARILDRLGRRALIDRTLKTDAQRAASLVESMKPAGAAAALERMRPGRAVDVFNAMSASSTAKIVEHMGHEAAVEALKSMSVERAAATMELLDLTEPEWTFPVLNVFGTPDFVTMEASDVKKWTVPVLNVTPPARARAIVELFERHRAQHALALMNEPQRLAVIRLMAPLPYVKIRSAEHPMGAFDKGWARYFRPWKRAACASAFILWLTTIVLFCLVWVHSIDNPQWNGWAPWGLLLWPIGLTALVLGIVMTGRDTDRLEYLAGGTFGFSMTTVVLTLTVTHVLSAAFVLGAVITMLVGIVSGLSFLPAEEQDRRETKVLPDSLTALSRPAVDSADSPGAVGAEAAGPKDRTLTHQATPGRGTRAACDAPSPPPQAVAHDGFTADPTVREAFQELSAALLEAMDVPSAAADLEQSPPYQAAGIAAHIDSAQLGAILHVADIPHAAEILARMAPAKAAEALRHVDPDHRAALLLALNRLPHDL
jgi:flagellar motility protein MotE (MotC chaperone)